MIIYVFQLCFGRLSDYSSTRWLLGSWVGQTQHWTQILALQNSLILSASVTSQIIPSARCFGSWLSWKQHLINLVGGWATPLKNMWKSIGMMRFSIYGKIKNDGNQTTNQLGESLEVPHDFQCGFDFWGAPLQPMATYLPPALAQMILLGVTRTTTAAQPTALATSALCGAFIRWSLGHQTFDGDWIRGW